MFGQYLCRNFLTGTAMRWKMLLTIGAVLAVLATCDKNDPGYSEATITGTDMRECMCCGGWYIVIDGSTYRFYTLPAGSDLDLSKARLPLKVFVKWQKSSHPCLGDEITINEISTKAP